jgi:transcriptional regulator with XRE-family HTH domain
LTPIDRILNLMEQNNVTAATLTKEIPLTNGVISQWKRGKQNPSTDSIIKIANYFHVTTDYILLGKQNLKTGDGYLKEINERITNLLSSNSAFSQKDLANYIGKQPSTLSNWLLKDREIPSSYLIPICEYLNVSLNYLLTGSEIESSNVTTSASDQEWLDLIHQLPEDVQREYKAEIKGYVKALNKESGEMPGKSLA